MIEIRKIHDAPTSVFAIEFSGILTLEESVSASLELGEQIRLLGGEPFRVLCDLTRTVTMPEEVADVFMKTQSLAVQAGMKRDAFVTPSGTLRLQLNRLAKTNHRVDALGPLRFFDHIEEAQAYILG